MIFDEMVEVVNSKQTVRLKMEELARLFQSKFNGDTGKDGKGTDEALDVLLLILLCEPNRNLKKVL